MDTKSISRTIDRAGAAAEDAASTVSAAAQDAAGTVQHRAADLRDAIATYAEDLSDDARDLADDVDAEGSSLVAVLLVLGLVGLALYLLKRRREQELDEALWEEPRAL